MNHILEMALKLVEAGIPVFPCKPWSKAPATRNGFLDASTDPEQVVEWFDNDRGFNLAVACGRHPSGLNLLMVDVDPKNGGDVTWAGLVAEHGEPFAPRHLTPSGGFHLAFDWGNGDGDAPTGPNRLGPGIDTRGEGGYVVVPPSRLHDDNGEVIAYRASRASSIAVNPIPAVPLWVRAASTTVPPQVRASMDRHPSQGVGWITQMFEKVRAGWDWGSELVADGWQEVRASAGERRFVRPGKDRREGHSASLHPSGAFVVWTTERPFGGKLTNGAGGASFSPGEYVLAYRFGDDRVAMGACYGFGPGAGTARTVAVPAEPGAGSDPAQGDGTPPPLFLPASWYEQRPWMAACLQMAQAVGGSPSAHLLAFLLRWATLIPPGYSIPPINGAPSSFDLLGVIAGTSGSGKTSPMRNAAELLPIHRDDLRHGLGIGSGEGIIEAFYGMETIEEDGKKRRERRKCIAGVNFAVSEGLIFAELAGRGGTTHVTRLCDAWSGAALSTANASAETFRHIDVNQYRLTLVMGLQADMAHMLMTDSAASQGFVGRLLFAWAEEPRVSPRPRPPDRPSLPIPAAIRGEGVFTQTYLSYPDEVYAECQAASDARVGTSVPVEDHHHDLMRCKVAGVVALMDGRRDVTLADWALATDLVTVSANVRRHLYEHRRQMVRDERHRQAATRAEVEIVVDDIKERRAIASMAENIRRSAEGGIPTGALRKKVSASKTRHRFEAALALAVSNGWVTVRDGQVEKA